MPLVRQLLIVALLAAAAFGGYRAWQVIEPGSAGGAGNGSAPRAATLVEAVQVERRKMETTIEAVGTTIAASSVEIVPLVEGRVEKIAFRAGQHVAASEVLAELDSDLQRADLSEAEATLRRVELELERVSRLYGREIVSTARVEEMTAELATAKAAVARARRNLADRTIRAPFAGTIGLNRVDIGARVTETTVITTLDDLSHVEVEFQIAENLFGITRLGQKVDTRTAAYPGRVFTGEIVEIDSRIDAVSRAFRVRADLPNEDRALPAGMFMQVTITLDGGEAAVIPEEAVVAEEGSAFVFVVEDGKAARRTITTGRRAPGFVEVVDGLAPDALVVTRGTNKLRDGAGVKLASGKTENGG
ncbi:MAG: efflux RND transporter periplasmic adaptor subunit [Rhodobiaceae bacterium]|nr:efflux RND transporter periplasmic adaptor subunit [Rhodobiaceae bacterium]MCC0015150.1 efflux RND transporter periplasmic adaptor subunit [Rhodobiaceae bacterium]MCC0040782.1 efflux RND transporter periplasmic adaptor subunit [Rhodobiaceae bacterium]MCC0053609.1 efflux RND transporter periplasmic adaptor subunit [Rhodobiaceae bacterium]